MANILCKDVILNYHKQPNKYNAKIIVKIPYKMIVVSNYQDKKINKTQIIMDKIPCKTIVALNYHKENKLVKIS